MEMIPLIEYEDISEPIKDELIAYYRGTDNGIIIRDSYSRYPYLFDFDYDNLTQLDRWFLAQMPDDSYGSVGYIIIHWDW